MAIMIEHSLPSVWVDNCPSLRGLAGDNYLDRRTRADPLGDLWNAEVVPRLNGAPRLMAVTVLEELQRRYPERFGKSVLRTVQRRVRQWRAESRRGATLERVLYLSFDDDRLADIASELARSRTDQLGRDRG